MPLAHWATHTRWPDPSNGRLDRGILGRMDNLQVGYPISVRLPSISCKALVPTNTMLRPKHRAYQATRSTSLLCCL